MNRKRVIIAGILAFVYPGLGHVYLRAWLRAAAWFGLALITAFLVIPESTLQSVEAGGLDAFITASQNLPDDVVLSLGVVRLLNVFDAILLAIRSPGNKQDSEGPACPQCGKSLDPDLVFCPWCSTELEGTHEGQVTE